ncbi:MAG: hypothetical protein M3297_14795 [Thermoproteota archaeon]|nr:hypothetical protein [Thermoproteota archaeon]
MLIFTVQNDTDDVSASRDLDKTNRGPDVLIELERIHRLETRLTELEQMDAH